MSPTQENLARALPDVAKEARPALAGRLDWVGMDNIEMPVMFADSGAGQGPMAVARVSAKVNLARPDVRGIHMSRLYLHVDRALGAEPLSACMLRRLLKDFLDSHAGLSDRARLRIDAQLMLRRRALVSDNSGWKAYPVHVVATMEQSRFELELGVKVGYSSTCPCSAALARQLIQDNFAETFPEGGAVERAAVLAWLGTEAAIDATPHSQRSEATVRVKLLPSFKELPFVELVDALEAALGTPVQTAVKREDEQAFARLNGRNLMFCEDAARRMQAALDADERILDFQVRAAHLESLHPHDAVAVASKGVPGGYGDIG
jgi:GTP cyclohydrolase I